MPWGFRKTVKMGPFRMTFSKSGISTSVGVPGARMTVGPRGTYVTVGAGGIYYRHRLDVPGNASGPGHPHGAQPAQSQTTALSAASSVETVDMMALAVTSADDVTREINDRWKRFEWSKVSLTAAILLVLVGFGNPLLFLPAILAVALTWYLRDAEKRAKTVCLTYQLDPVAQAAYNQMAAFWQHLATSQKLWSIIATINTNDYKRNAGASNLIQRKPVSLSNHPPRFLETNLPTYTLTAGPYRLYFLPDRLLVQANALVSAIPYHRLVVQGGQTRFVEEEAVARDTHVVSQTWRYVNKNGGPDRRFNNNRQLPVCLYGVIQIDSTPGLRLELHCSNPNLAAQAAGSFTGLGRLSASVAIR